MNNAPTKTLLRCTALVTVLGSLSATVAQAEPTNTVDREEEAPKKAKRRHLRMGLELATIMVVGDRWYWRDNGKPNEIDWQLPMDASAAGSKLTGTDAWRFDGNDYDINALGHPGFGMLTHFLARENNYSVAESFTISTIASGGWEVFLELAEYGSINDALSTSTAGVPLGESAYQILHHLDETQFQVSAGAGTDNGAGFAVVSARADLDRTPDHGDARTHAGEKVSIAIEATADDGVRSIEGAAKSSLLGYRRNRARTSVFTGLSTEFDYGKRSDRPERAWDRLTMVAAGPTVEVQYRSHGVTVDAGADAYFDFAMVKSEAYDAWRMTNPTAILRNTMQGKDKPYYYAFGGTIDPHVNVAYGNLNVGGKVAASRFGSIDSNDRDQEMVTADVHFTDTNATAESWVGYQHKGVAVTLDGRLHKRAGSVGGVEASSSAKTAMLTVAFMR